MAKSPLTKKPNPKPPSKPPKAPSKPPKSPSKPPSKPPTKPPPKPPTKPPSKPIPGISVPWTIEELNQDSPPPPGMQWQLQPHGGAILVPMPSTSTPPSPPPISPSPYYPSRPPTVAAPSPSPAAPPPTPSTTWDTNVTYKAPTGIKQAPIDTIVFNDITDPDYISQSFFDEFGGTELIKISRTDLINGANVSYSPIKNLAKLSEEYNSFNIIDIFSFQQLSEKNKINLYERGMKDPYFNNQGDLVVEIDEIKEDESVEIQISIDGTIGLIGE